MHPSRHPERLRHDYADVFDRMAFATLGPAGEVRAAAAGDANGEDGLKRLERFTTVATTGGYLSSDDFFQFISDAESGVVQRGMFEGRGPIAILLLVLIGGLALNLTPCVLPMIPINLAIIGAGAQAGSRRRGFLLGSAYGGAMALVYGALGLLVVLTAGTFATINSSPWFNAGIAALFVILGLAMFDVFDIDFSRFSSGSQHASDAAAFERFRASLPAAAGKTAAEIAAMDLRLHDAQSCVAREYGFPSWVNLKNYVDLRNNVLLRNRTSAIPVWLNVAYGHEYDRPQPEKAVIILEEHPELIQGDVDVLLSCAVGDDAVVRAAIERDPDIVHRTFDAWTCPCCNWVGYAMPPLVAVTHSGMLRLERFRDGLHRTARLLLDAGADPKQSTRTPTMSP